VASLIDRAIADEPSDPALTARPLRVHTRGWAVKRQLRRGRPPSADPDPAYFLVQFADDEEPEPAALAFFASRFSFSDLLAAVFELFDPPLSLLAMVTSSRRSDRVLTVSPWTPSTDLLDAEGANPERDAVAGQMEAGRTNESQESLAYGERHGDHRAARRPGLRP
jgi:hypothetical protein